MSTKLPANPSPLPPISSENDILPGLETWRRVLSKAIGTAPTPGKVTSFTATSIGGGIQLAWQKSQDADGYIIERSSTINFTPLETITISDGAQITYLDPIPSVSTQFYRIYATSGTTSAPHSVRSQVSIIAKATAQSLGGVRYVSTFSGADIGARINAAIAVGPNAEIVVDESGTQTTLVIINQANVWLRAVEGITLTKGVNGAQITSAANGCRVSGFILNGNKAGGFSGTGITANSVDGPEVDHCTITSQANGVTSGFGIFFNNCTNFSIHDNKVSNNDSFPIAAWANVTNGISERGLITRNFCDSTAGVGVDQHAISIRANASASILRHVTVSNNVCVPGSGFGVEAFFTTGATAIEHIVTAGNNIRRTVAGDGGISFSGVIGGAITGNVVDLGGQSATFNIELASSQNIAVTGNHIDCTSTAPGGIFVDGGTGGSSHNTIIGNTVLNVQGATSAAGIVVVIGGAGTSQNNVISGNTIVLAGSAQNYGIWLQANNASAHLDRTIVTFNTIQGSAFATQQGIRVELDAGTLDGTQIVGNVVNNCGQGIATTLDTHTLVLSNRVLNTTTPYLTTGPGTGSGLILSSLYANSAVSLRSGAAPAQGFDFVLDNNGTQANANVPWVRLGGANDSPIFNAGSATGQIAFNLDQTGAFVNIGGAGLQLGGGNIKVTQIAGYAPTLTPASVPAQSSNEQTFTVTGLATSDKVLLNPGAQTAGVFPAYFRVSAANTLTIGFVNVTAGALTPASTTYLIYAFRN